MHSRSVACALALVVAAGCSTERVVPGAALESITAADLADHIEVLASDSFAGRAPGTVGEERTVAYLTQEFTRLGLEPGNDTSFFQVVPMIRSVITPLSPLIVRGGPEPIPLAYRTDFVAWTLRVTQSVALANSEMVFVGYGIDAPEYGWNDYEGLDVQGKTVVMLVNDPGFATGDTALFRGSAMTYYGRWTYKYEEAARKGAQAAIIVHETAPAAYPWEVVENGWTGPQFQLEAADGYMSRVAVEGWITLEAARRLFGAAGLDFETLKQQATQRGFQPVDMGDLTASLRLANAIERSTSRNVLARLPGTSRADEYVVYMGHWDHFGTDTTRQGDRIFNGAKDNATGTAALIEMAEAFAGLSSPPARSVLFLATTAEEQGLLGSEHYAANPVVPLDRTVAAINMDALNTLGPMRDITVVGYGNSELDELVEQAAGEQDRVVRSDAEPEKGFYYRSDHFPFAKVGVPALYVDPGVDHVEHGEAWTRERNADYTANHYHKPSDEVDPTWDLAGMVDDVRLLFRVGYRLAMSDAFPSWREGTEFKARRDAMMGR